MNFIDKSIIQPIYSVYDILFKDIVCIFKKNKGIILPMFFKKNLWLTISLLCFLGELFAQNEQTNSYSFYSFDLIKSEGLFKGVIKDDKGYVWIASDEGITLFDGQQTKIIKDALTSEYIKDFLIRKNGDFLVLHDTGLAELNFVNDSIQVTDYLGVNLNYPKAMYEDAAGKLFIGEYDRITEFYKGKIIKHDLPDENNIPSLLRTFIFDEDGYGNVWAASYTGRLYTYNRYQSEFSELVLPKNVGGINSLICTGQNNLLIGSANGFYRLKVNKDQELTEMEEMPYSLNDISVMHLLDDDLLIGTWNNGLYQMKLDAPNFEMQKISVLPHPDIVDIYVDQDGIWIAGNENIGYLEKAPFGAVPLRGEKNLISSLDLTPGNDIVVSEGVQIFILEPQADTSVRLSYNWEADGIYVKKVVYDNDAIWLGDFNGDVYIHDISTGKTTLVDDMPVGGLGIEDMMKDSKGAIWACGNPNVGVIRYSKPGIKYFNDHPAITGSTTLFENESGQILASGNTNGIVFNFNEETDNFDSLLITDQQGNRLTSLIVNDITVYKGNVYLATNEGVYYYADNQVKGALAVAQLRLDNFTKIESKAICVDADGNFWIANNFGLLYLNNKGETTFYDRTQGLPSKIIKERGLLLDLNQKLWIATEKGLSYIKRPSQLIKKAKEPILKTIRIDNKRINYNSTSNDNIYTAPDSYSDKNMELEFQSDIYPKQSLEYHYKLTSEDTALDYISKSPLFTSYNLPIGNYELLVKVRKDTGYYWSEAIRVNFAVKSYFYQQWWAIALGFLVSWLILFYIGRWYKRRVKRQQLHLEKLVAERTEELNQQKSELIEQQQQIILQKDELITKNNSLFETKSALTQAELKFRESKERQLEDELEYRNKQLTSHTLNILQKSELMEELAGKLEKLINEHGEDPYSELKKIKKYIDNSLQLEKDWDDFKLYFEQVHTSFYSKLSISHPNLTANELRHCALIRLNLSLTECAAILGISAESVKISRFRLRKKLELQNNQSLTEFIMGI